MAIYTNRLRIRWTKEEIHVDFAQEAPSSGGTQVVAPIVMLPVMAKLLSRDLSRAIREYESEHGEVDEPGNLVTAAPGDLGVN